MATNLNRDERIQIQTLLNTGKKASQIATYLGRHKTTIYRELDRYTDSNGKYCFTTACQEAKQSMCRISKRGPSAQIIAIVDQKLTNEQWSPQQIAGWLKLKHTETVSHGWIYNHIADDEAKGGEEGAFA